MLIISKYVGEQINFTTADGVSISASFVQSPTPKNTVVLLLHQLRKDRSIWDALVQKLATSGFSSLAIDFRGHGQSGGGSWEDFSDDQFKAMIGDVEAAGRYLKERLPSSEIAIIGASIGANLALNYAVKNEVSRVVLLSPGLSYHGITTEEAASGLSKPLFVAASSDDPNPAMDAMKRIEELAMTPDSLLKVVTYSDAGHGVNMFSKYPQLQDEIVLWLK
ncbi:MAG: alpha/beta fold hydrolase [Candidatus Woykebacteria bacterium]